MDETKAKKRDSLIAKVRALLAKTVENGATEQEALLAAAKAAELMALYDLEMDEVQAREEGVAQEEFDIHPTFFRHMTRISMAIADLCDVRTWKNTSSSRRVFFGLPHDVEVARYLAEICERAMRTDVDRASQEWVLFPRKRHKLSDSFLSGMTQRLCERIEELAWARHRATGTALVPLKDAIIEQAMKDKGIGLKDARIGWRDVDPRAFAAGIAAGSRVQLRPGVSEAEAAAGVLAGEPDPITRNQTEDVDGTAG